MGLPADGFFRDNGSANWTPGSYRLIFDEMRATHFQIGNDLKVEVPAWVVITKAFTLTDNHDDAVAAASLQGTSHTLKNYFEPPHGPHSYRIWSARCTWVRDEVARIAAKLEVSRLEAARQTGTGAEQPVVCDEIAATTAVKRKAAAEKARSALAVRKESLAKQRRVKL